jgi:hypothetical protein
MSKDTSLSKKIIFIFYGEQKIQISIGQAWHHILKQTEIWKKYGGKYGGC